MALSIMVKFTKPGRLIAQTSYLGRFKPLKKFGKSFLKSVKVYRRILDLAHCVWRETGEKYKNALIQVYYAKGVTEIKLTVYDANGNNQNAVINEIRVPSE